LRSIGLTFLRRIAIGAAILAAMLGLLIAAGLSFRAWDALRSPPLEVWHTFVPDEPDAEAIDDADWAAYFRAEERVFDEVAQEVIRKPDTAGQVPINRYVATSPVDPQGFATDWNRSYLMEPDREPIGAAVFLHGLTDSPYSLRHLAALYRRKGFVAIGIRLPGHGTVPGALTEVEWEDWMAATRLAVREAVRRAGPARNRLHIVGFSNGGALAVKYALDAIGNDGHARPERLVLLSPMIGITAFARYAGLAGLPAFFPAFARAAWLDVLPEFNPFKYNSFPINGARQSHLLTAALQQKIANHASNNRLAGLAPILTFQSVMDFTVSTRAIVSALYAHLPANGSELVLFDVNRNTKFGPLLSSASDTMLNRILPEPPRRFRTTIVTNATPDSAEVVERVVEAGAVEEQIRDLGLFYPIDVYSLSHVALPFPTSDSLYGLQPDPTEDFGINLGALAARGGARSPDRQHGFAASHVVQPVLSLSDSAYRGNFDAQCIP
jgi:alpha-beta hydrolase superfamily lysophospholipase